MLHVAIRITIKLQGKFNQRSKARSSLPCRDFDLQFGIFVHK